MNDTQVVPTRSRETIRIIERAERENASRRWLECKTADGSTIRCFKTDLWSALSTDASIVVDVDTDERNGSRYRRIVAVHRDGSPTQIATPTAAAEVDEDRLDRRAAAIAAASLLANKNGEAAASPVALVLAVAETIREYIRTGKIDDAPF